MLNDALIDRLLRLPEDDRIWLSTLLSDSVRRGFDSLEAAARADRDMIRERVEAFERGEVPALDWRESLERVRQKLRQRFAE